MLGLVKTAEINMNEINKKALWIFVSHFGSKSIVDKNIKKLAKIALDAEILRLICYRVTSVQENGGVPNYEASTAKVFASELLCRTANDAMDILGPWGQLDRGSKLAVLNGAFARQFLHAPSMNVGGGTSEVQRNIIAMRGLGLPRS